MKRTKLTLNPTRIALGPLEDSGRALGGHAGLLALALFTLLMAQSIVARPAVVTLPIEVFPIAADVASTNIFFDPETEDASKYSVATPMFCTGTSLNSNKADGYLELTGHSLGYRFKIHSGTGAGTFGGKASVRLSDGPWVDLIGDRENQTSKVEIRGAARQYGGIGGGFKTLTVRIPLTELVDNSIEFDKTCSDALDLHHMELRFNGTEGVTSGFRVISFQIYDQQETEQIDSNTPFDKDSPGSWRGPEGGNPAQGATLWTTAELYDSPLDQTVISARCSSCHALDGRDLQYFSYSNQSIISRAMFHGLTRQEGEHIAAYIRSNEETPRGRPWKPPFQPGAGIDSRPADRWSAGSTSRGNFSTGEIGFEDPAMVEELFRLPPSEINAKAVENLFLGRRKDGSDLPARTINLRELSVAIQLPDWNSWLPMKHPSDIFDDFDTAIDSPESVYQDIREELELLDLSNDAAVENLLGDLSLLASLGKQTIDYVSLIADGGGVNLGSGWRDFGDRVIDAFNAKGVNYEVSKRNLARWVAVKSWELVREFSLETLAGDGRLSQYVDGSNVALCGQANCAESLIWPMGSSYSVHPIAPHIVANDILDPLDPEGPPPPPGKRYHFTKHPILAIASPEDSINNYDQDPIVGRYESTAWYHLQMILNPGARQVVAGSPVDWIYYYNHVGKLGQDIEDYYPGIPYPEGSGMDLRHWESTRYLATLVKGIQMRNNGVGPTKKGYMLRYTSPALILSPGTTYTEDDPRDELIYGLDRLQASLRKTVIKGFLGMSAGIFERFDDDDSWVYCGGSEKDWWCIDDGSYQPDFGSYQSSTKLFNEFKHADDFYHLLRQAETRHNINPGSPRYKAFKCWVRNRWPVSLGDWGLAAFDCGP